jgi:hypothetical protein
MLSSFNQDFKMWQYISVTVKFNVNVFSRSRVSLRLQTDRRSTIMQIRLKFFPPACSVHTKVIPRFTTYPFHAKSSHRNISASRRWRLNRYTNIMFGTVHCAQHIFMPSRRIVTCIHHRQQIAACNQRFIF